MGRGGTIINEAEWMEEEGSEEEEKQGTEANMLSSMKK